METETLLIEQLEAIIHRLTQRIEDAGQLPQKRNRLRKQFRQKMQKNLERVQAFRAHFGGTRPLTVALAQDTHMGGKR